MKKVFRYIAVCAVLFGTTNCDSDFEEINTDPTKASASNFNPNFLLTTSELRYTGSQDFSYETWRSQLIYCSTIVQHFATVLGYWAGDKYGLNLAYQSSYWERAYDEQVKNVVDLIELTKDKPETKNLHNIGRIMKVVIFHRLTDLYGDVPYSEAGQGYYKQIFTPKYDKQADIYADMLKELEEASTALGTGVDASITGDLVYGGDLDKWKRFANSMMLRLGMRLSKVDAASAQKWAEKAAKAGVMTGISDNAFIMHDASGGRPTINRISQVLNLGDETKYVRWSKTFIDFLKSNNDPRLSLVAELTDGTNEAAKQLGQPNGFDLGGGATDISKAPNYPGSIDKYSRPRKALLTKDAGPTFFQTYAEVELLLAEAAQNGWNVGGTAAGHYANGVSAAMKSLSQFDASAGSIADGDILAYLALHPYDPSKGLEMINTQYWVATIFNDYESFANWRRSGFPALTPIVSPAGVTNGVIPRRFVYPVIEASANGTNLAAAVTGLSGGDKMTSRVWWDK